MKKVLSLMAMMMVHSYAFGSNNIFTGKTQPTKGAAAIGVVIGVDDSVLKEAATANGKSQCYDAGFSYCYAINETYDTVEDASGFYAKIMVEGFHEVPDKYKPTPVEAIQPPVGSVCIFVPLDTNYQITDYRIYVEYSDGSEAFIERKDRISRFDILNTVFHNLKTQGACETYRFKTCRLWSC